MKNIDKSIVNQIKREIESLKTLNNHVSLAGSFKGAYRVRVGNYRVIYSLEENEVVILSIGHRKAIYR
ncbi:MAG: type II toxin-antitoxin system RelE/ParE family toxin [Nitrospirae bacterium]|nr:type II toxin-antitoxin system RelE/ParE family toxin [Nitrospirota bacterium]